MINTILREKNTIIKMININYVKELMENRTFLDRYFLAKELHYLDMKKSEKQKPQSIAARVVAKEALLDLLKSRIRSDLKNISIVNDEYGKPEIQLYGSLEELFKKKGGKKILLSLSHEREYAAAFILIIKQKE